MNDLTHNYLDSSAEATANLYVFPKRADELGKSPTRSPLLKPALFLLALILVAAAGTRAWYNWRADQALSSYTQALSQRTVLITQAKPGALAQQVRLPTSLRGDTEAAVYARSTGYLSAWHKGIGDRVEKDELLATIDAPEQEQELAQANAQRQQAEARLALARQTLDRWEKLGAQSGAVTQQDLAEKRSHVQQAEADLAAADANARRLEQQQEFRRITAPFAGVITRRNIEVGDLIRNAGQPLFSIAAVDPLRLTVWIPQSYAHHIQVGQEVNVLLKEQPGADIKARVERLAGGLDPQTRARQADLTLPNPRGTLLPGAYAEIQFTLTNPTTALLVPPSVLLINAQGPQVVVLDKENRVEFRPVKLGRDLGREVEVLAGITAADRLVVSPSDQLRNGEVVEVRVWGG
ncbi:MAG: efflux RND transporter periplasmic adaptor subunit [Cellvibrionaceae bacterium]|nr:efflux RND transporter periplasmic adaptor subunit [Cellvibrionaceae bacterium]